eukprot:362855-Chlamydomonas_euryale.AAC.2
MKESKGPEGGRTVHMRSRASASACEANTSETGEGGRQKRESRGKQGVDPKRSGDVNKRAGVQLPPRQRSALLFVFGMRGKNGSHADQSAHMQIRAPACVSERLYADQSAYMRVRPSTCGSERLRADQSTYVQIRAPTCVSERLHADQSAYMRVRQPTCGSERLRADQSAYMRVRAPTCGSERLHAERTFLEGGGAKEGEQRQIERAKGSEGDAQVHRGVHRLRAGRTGQQSTPPHTHACVQDKLLTAAARVRGLSDRISEGERQVASVAELAHARGVQLADVQVRAQSTPTHTKCTSPQDLASRGRQAPPLASQSTLASQPCPASPLLPANPHFPASLFMRASPQTSQPTLASRPAHLPASQHTCQPARTDQAGSWLKGAAGHMYRAQVS